MHRLFGFIFVLVVNLAISPAGAEEHALPTSGPEEPVCAEGDFLCDHEAFHSVYKGLELVTGKSCCHNSECRPARVRAARGGAGGEYEAFVDGRWCPVSANAALHLSEEQKRELRSKVPQSILREFLARTHACAPQSARDGPCPTVYCFWKLPDMY